MPRGTLFRSTGATAALVAVTALGGAAYGVIEYDQDVTPDVIFGSGNANGSFTTDRVGSVELGLRAKLRFPPSNVFNSNGDGTYTYDVGSGTSSPPDPEWAFEWSVNTDYDTSSGTKIDDLTYELGIDFDPSAATDYLVFDPITPGSYLPFWPPVGPTVFWDHSIGDNSTGNGAGTEAGDGPTYVGLIAANNVAQNSWRTGFFDDSPFDTFDPDVPGRYELYLAAFDGAAEVARTHITVIVTDGPSLTLEAAACQGDLDAAAGVQIAVNLYMRNLGSDVTGFQAFLEFLPAEMTYNTVLSTYNDTVFPNHITDIDDAGFGLPAGELRLDGSVDFGDPGIDEDSLLATLVFDVLIADCASSSVDFDLTQLPFKSEVSYLGVPIVTALVDSGAMTVDDTDPAITCPDPIVVNADAGLCTASVFAESFDTAVSTCAIQTPDCWYVDRFAPAVFENAFFDGEMRLEHGVDAVDYGGGIFTDTQGRKYDIDMPVGTTLSAELYIPSTWETPDRRAGLWATTFDGLGVISGFPIVGFTSADDDPRFRVFTQDDDQDPGNGYDADWTDLYSLVPADYDRWYRFEITLTAAAYEMRVIDVATDTVVASFHDGLTFGSIRFGNVILQVYNFGETYSAYWDNVTLNPSGPVATDNCELVSLTYERDDGATLTLADPFPTGTTTITWTATDCAGNTAVCAQTVTVDAFNDLALVGTLDGSGVATRCIRVELDCTTTYDIEVDVDSSGFFADVLEIPCGTYGTVCLKDEQHTLWASASLAVSGSVYVADSALVLEPGDTDNDSDVDINDVTWLLAQWALPANDGDCPWDGATRDADFDNNTVVGSPDYSLLSGNWLTFTTCSCLSPFGGGLKKLPMTSVPTTHLDPSVAARADLNDDGVIDFRDVRIFEEVNRLPDTLSTAILLTEVRGRGR